MAVKLFCGSSVDTSILCLCNLGHCNYEVLSCVICLMYRLSVELLSLRAERGYSRLIAAHETMTDGTIPV